MPQLPPPVSPRPAHRIRGDAVANGGARAFPKRRRWHSATTVGLCGDAGDPADLEDFAVGFSLTEGIIPPPGDRGAGVVAAEQGIELRMWLAPERRIRFTAASAAWPGRAAAGCAEWKISPKPCGRRPVGAVDALPRARDPRRNGALPRAQSSISDARGACGGLLAPERGLVALREDVGRHNALDKLAGALAPTAIAVGRIVVLTSRISVEMVQKTAMLGAPVIVAVSAPTALAVRVAEAAASR